MTDIYQQIWNSDRHKLSVSHRDRQGKWLNPKAEILIDEQVAAFGRRDLDLARSPLFARIDETKFQTIPSYISFIKLLDNYRFDNQKSEIVTKLEQAEIEQFIRNICQSDPMQLARAYISRELNIKLSISEFERQLTSIWFDLYTNYFGNYAVKDASAFEHIFVGEGIYDRNNNSQDFISGYHSWIKFYLDERDRRVNYLGHNYKLQGDIGTENPYVVTLQMVLKDNLTQDKRQLFKKQGCFFVGTSPECEIAMGTVAYYEHLHLCDRKFIKDKRRTAINGAVYDLVLYRNIEPDGSRGDRIRSFYPIYLGTNF